MPRGDGIKPINKLFDKYKNQLTAPEGSVKKAFCEVIDDLYGFEVNEKQLRYSVYSHILTLRVPAALKTEIMLHKKEILTHLKGRLGEKNAPKTIL